MHAASAYGQIEVLHWLFFSGANMNVRDSDGDTPLHYAESVAVAEVLVGGGADVSARNNEGKTALACKLEDVLPEDDEDYDSDDNEQQELKRLVTYMTNLLKGGGSLTAAANSA